VWSAPIPQEVLSFMLDEDRNPEAIATEDEQIAVG
jgi:hypothetical protein